MDVLIKRWGRNVGGAAVHLIGPDGSSPLCGTRLVDEQWEVVTIQHQPRALCTRCRRLKSAARAAQEET